MRIPLTLLALASAYCSVNALDVKGRVHWNEICPGIGDLGQAKVILDNGKLYGGVTQSGGFVIPDVPAGTYVLSVVAHDHTFDKLRLDVFETESLPEVRPYFPGTPLSPPAPATLPYPITLIPRQKYDYFVARESFNILAMFQNPMMMLMVGGGVLMLAMPYIMKNMDPDTLQEFNERQARITNIQSSLQSGDLKSTLTAALNQNEPKPASKPAAPTGSAVKSRPGKNRKR